MYSANKRDADKVVSVHSPLHLLHRAGQLADEMFQVEMTDLELTPRQFAVLKAVASKEGLSQTDVVAMTGIDRSTTADLVSRLLKKGLLQRRRTKHDARAYAVRLTEQGARALKSAEPAARRVEAKLLDALPAKRASEFLTLLNTIIETFAAEKTAQAR